MIINKISQKYLSILFLIITVCPFITSFILEYFLQLIPCVLCLIERWIHFSVFILAFLYILYKKNWFFDIVFFGIIVNILTTIYHIGIELHIFESSCDSFKIINIDKISSSCAIPQYFITIKLTFWNIFYCVIEIFTIFLYKFLTIKKIDVIKS